MKNNTRLNAIAKAFSIIGHPFLTVAAYVCFFCFYHYGVQKAVYLSALVIGLVVIPIIARNWMKVHRGQYSNFDVSNREQRNNFYPPVLVLLVFLALVLYFTDQDNLLLFGAIVFLLLVVVLAIGNRWIKISLHASINFFIAAQLFPYGKTMASLALLFSLLVSLSRIVLGRHYWSEVLAGSSLGLLFGLLFYYLQDLYNLHG